MPNDPAQSMVFIFFRVGRGFWVYSILEYFISGIQYFCASNWVQSIPSRPILGIKYTVLFLILVFYMSFSIILGILEGLFRAFWYSTTPQPVYTYFPGTLHHLSSKSFNILQR